MLRVTRKRRSAAGDRRGVAALDRDVDRSLEKRRWMIAREQARHAHLDRRRGRPLPRIPRLAARAAAASLAPGATVIGVFFFVPVVAAALLSFTDFDIYAVASWTNLRFVWLEVFSLLRDPCSGPRSGTPSTSSSSAARSRSLFARRGAPRGRAGGPLQGVLPHGLLPARGDDARRGRRRVAISLSPAVRAPERALGLVRRPRNRLARRPHVGDARDHPDGRLEEFRIPDARVPRGAAGDPRAALRGGTPRRRHGLGAVPPRHAAAAGSHLHFRHGHHRDRLLPTVRGALRDDAAGDRPTARAASCSSCTSRASAGGTWARRRRSRSCSSRSSAATLVQSAAERAPGEARNRAVVVVHVAARGRRRADDGPLVWMVSASFMPAGESTTLPLRFLPSAPTLEQLRALFARMNIGRHLSAARSSATSVTVISLLLNSMAGYAFAKLRFGGRDTLFRILLSRARDPRPGLDAAAVPALEGDRDREYVPRRDRPRHGERSSASSSCGSTRWRFPTAFSMRRGSTARAKFRIYWSLVLPFCRPVLATLAVFTFLGTWNDFLWPLIVLADEDLYTLPVALANLLGEHAQDTELMMAGAVLTVLPVLAPLRRPAAPVRGGHHCRGRQGMRAHGRSPRRFCCSA